MPVAIFERRIRSEWTYRILACSVVLLQARAIIRMKQKGLDPLCGEGVDASIRHDGLLILEFGSGFALSDTTK